MIAVTNELLEEARAITRLVLDQTADEQTRLFSQEILMINPFIKHATPVVCRLANGSELTGYESNALTGYNNSNPRLKVFDTIEGALPFLFRSDAKIGILCRTEEFAMTMNRKACYSEGVKWFTSPEEMRGWRPDVYVVMQPSLFTQQEVEDALFGLLATQLPTETPITKNPRIFYATKALKIGSMPNPFIKQEKK